MDTKQLIKKAQEMLKKSYSPFSKFKVGACVLTESGKMFQGANIENASFGATICAERNAINNAILNGEHNFQAIAIVSQSGDYTYPCGICRQTMVEFSPEMLVIVAKNVDDYKTYRASELLPFYFNSKDIK